MVLISDLLIERLTERLIDHSLPKPEWTHEGHFAAALWLNRHRPDLVEPSGFKRIIISYNEATGTENTDSSGYHHTITVASLRAAAFHLAAHHYEVPICKVLSDLMASPLGAKAWLMSYWHHETLFSVHARRDWVEPDIKMLPF